MKRVRHPGKENQGPNICTPDLNNSNKINKKVRFVSPDGRKRLVPLNVLNPTPHVKKLEDQRKKVLAKKLENDYDFHSPYRARNYNKSVDGYEKDGNCEKNSDDVSTLKVYQKFLFIFLNNGRYFLL